VEKFLGLLRQLRHFWQEDMILPHGIVRA